MVDEELEGDWVDERDFSIDRLLLRRRRGGQRARRAAADRAARTATAASSTASSRRNVQPQRQEGFSTVEVKVTRGDLTPEQFRGLGADHARVHRRLRPHHRAAELRPALGPRRGALRRLAAARASSASATPAPHEITDVVSCPGTDSCKLGITSSMGLNQAIQERLEEMEIADPLTKRIHIKMSGCPNGCSQHHIANIGFYGASLKVGGRQMPAYIPHLGGNYEGGEVVYGHAAEGAAARQARARGGRALGAPLRGRAQRRRGVQRLRRARRHRRASRPRSRT